MRTPPATLATFEAIDAAWTANLDSDGRIRNLALSRRIADQERDVSICILGMDAEDIPTPEVDTQRRVASFGCGQKKSKRKMARCAPRDRFYSQ